MVFLLIALASGIIQSTDSVIHKLDDIALKELYKASKPKSMENPMPFGTDNRAQYEYWQLAHRIRTKKTFESIFTKNEQECFNNLAEKILQADTYQIAFREAKETKITWDQYRKIGAILAKNKLIDKGVKYQSEPSKSSFDKFLDVNINIDEEAIPWMIAGSMFLYYLRQIERENRITS